MSCKVPIDPDRQATRRLAEAFLPCQGSGVLEPASLVEQRHARRAWLPPGYGIARGLGARCRKASASRSSSRGSSAIQLALDDQGARGARPGVARRRSGRALPHRSPGPLPVDAAKRPRVVIPFASEPRKMALGSLAVDPRSGDLYLGGGERHRIYRLGADQRLHRGLGLNHLLGGSSWRSRARPARVPRLCES